MIKDYIKLLRPKHYIKNVLIFVPLFFNRDIFNREKFFMALIGVVCFSLISSAVYILNDIKDLDKDRNHPRKRNRPIASGRVSVKTAIMLMILCVLAATGISVIFLNPWSISILFTYFLLNVLYSFGLKNTPILDVFILASGFVLRIVYGGILTDVAVSNWLYLVVISGSLYMGLGKRRNELQRQSDTRNVLKYYSEAFLDKNMYVCVALVIMFYSLWTVDSGESLMVFTIPVLIMIMMKYSLNIEGDSDGDPVEVLLHDKYLLILALLYISLIILIIYVV